jgi:alkylation response protein AidB-like acyl-CoA dehydrogenase
MRFTWTEEQQLLRASLTKYVAERYTFENRRRRIAAGFDATIWKELAELGILGLPFDERYGGSGGSMLDTLIVMEAFGRGLVVEPYLASIILGGGLLRHAANESQKSQLIPTLIAGELRLAFAFAEPQARFNLSKVTTRARAVDNGYVLKGQKSVVYGAPEAHQLFITARTAGQDDADRHGISVFLVPTDRPELQMQRYRCVDGMSAAEVVMRDVPLPADSLVGELHGALPAIERVIDEATIAICGEAVGMMAALNEKCVDYSKNRHAFGEPIAEFQAVAHRIVDMHVAYEQAAAMAIKAAAKLAGVSHDSANNDAARTVAACKAKVGPESAFVGKSAVQLHGAIGITDELDIGHYFKRLMAIQTLFGNTDHHLRRYIALGAHSSTSAQRTTHGY